MQEYCGKNELSVGGADTEMGADLSEDSDELTEEVLKKDPISAVLNPIDGSITITMILEKEKIMSENYITDNVNRPFTNQQQNDTIELTQCENEVGLTQNMVSYDKLFQKFYKADMKNEKYKQETYAIKILLAEKDLKIKELQENLNEIIECEVGNSMDNEVKAMITNLGEKIADLTITMNKFHDEVSPKIESTNISVAKMEVKLDRVESDVHEIKEGKKSFFTHIIGPIITGIIVGAIVAFITVNLKK